MSKNEVVAEKPGPRAEAVLGWTVRFWFAITAFGQAAFIYFILAFYGVRTAGGRFAAWNDKPLITGHVMGDHAGNAMFALHVLLAAVVTLGGLAQLVPSLRRTFPVLHRWTGRTFLSLSIVMAVSGAWLVLARGSYLSTISAVAILINAALILVFAVMAWREALRRRFDAHRRWATRAFMVVSGVWFLRIGFMGWLMLNGRPAGMTKNMNGPADIVMVFGCYLIPLAVLEVYFAARRGGHPAGKLAAALLIALGAAYTAAGVFGAISFMWWRYL